MRVLLARNRIMLGQFADVRSRDKRLLARPGENRYANRGIVLDIGKRQAQFLHGGHVERIQHLRPVHGDVSNRVFLFVKNVFGVHKFTYVQAACHPERSKTIRLANRFAESKDPFQLALSLARKGVLSRPLGECLSVTTVVPAQKGSFDCVRTSLREILAPLRMTFKSRYSLFARGLSGSE